MNLNRKAAWKAIIKDVMGKELTMGRKSVRFVSNGSQKQILLVIEYLVELVIKNYLGFTIHQQKYGEQARKYVESVTK